MKIFIATIALALLAAVGAQSDCNKTISFAIINNNQVIPLNVANPKNSWVAKWVKKNAKKFSDICFGEPMTGLQNYSIVLSNSRESFAGFQAVTSTNTNTNYVPVSGSGTVTSNYGNTWNYTYQGSMTITTTTTSTEAVPYTINNNYLFATGYNASGGIVSQKDHLYSAYSGGDASYSLGYNVTGALMAINARGRLMSSIVSDISPKDSEKKSKVNNKLNKDVKTNVAWCQSHPSHVWSSGETCTQYLALFSKQ
jgi:hypothetical protein